MSVSAQIVDWGMAILIINVLEAIEMTVTSRCNYAGPLGKLIPTRSFAALVRSLLRSR
jgi:hypothetical protein